MRSHCLKEEQYYLLHAYEGRWKDLDALIKWRWKAAQLLSVTHRGRKKEESFKLKSNAGMRTNRYL